MASSAGGGSGNGKSKNSWMKTNKDRETDVNSSRVYRTADIPDPSQDSNGAENILLIDSNNWKAFFNTKSKPQDGEWLADNCPGVKDRSGQSFYGYSRYSYLRYPRPKQMTIGLKYIGHFDMKLSYFNNDKSNTNKTDCNNKNNNNNDKSNNNKSNSNTSDLKESKSEEKSSDSSDGKDVSGNEKVSLLSMLSEIIEIFYGMPVRILNPMSMNGITQRFNDFSDTHQLHTQAIHPKLRVDRRQDSVCFQNYKPIN